MIEIAIPKEIKIGGFDYSVEISPHHNKELAAATLYGQCSGTLKRIRLSDEWNPQQISETFIHEIIHAIDEIYCNSKLTEDLSASLANGLLQIFEQLGLRFVKKDA